MASDLGIEELSQRRQEWVDASKKNDFEKGIVGLLTHQYADKTHFIYELLQNADDAKATAAWFRLDTDSLTFTHNGTRAFSNKDVEDITSIGTSAKQSDYTQIGKHGIGFKAVFSYTYTPRIHSGDKHFEILNLVVPSLLTDERIPADLSDGETRFILPFDNDTTPTDHRFRPLVSAEKAFSAIRDALVNLPLRTLLFLRDLRTIGWEADSQSVLMERKDLPAPDSGATRVGLDNGEQREEWIVFRRETSVEDENERGETIQYRALIEVAFQVEQKKVVPAKDTRLAVFFQTKVPTGLGFLIQAPFKTTKTREQLPDGDSANDDLIAVAASLAADSLEDLRDLDLLDVNSYDALPLCIQDFPEKGFFRPVFDRIREAVGTRQLLPKQGGGFVAATEAKLARGARLVELFDSKQLGQIYGRDRLEWLDVTIKESTPLYEYIAGRRKQYSQTEWVVEPLINEVIVDPQRITSKLSEDFLSEQADDWFHRFYEFLLEQESLWKAAPNPWDSPGLLRCKPILRLEDGTQVAPFDASGNPNAYLPPEHQTTFRVVRRSITKHQPALEFLRRLGLSDPDEVADVIENTLPKYRAEARLQIEDKAYRTDIDAIFRALKTDSQEKKQRLLDETRKTPFVRAMNTATGAIAFKKPEEVWFATDDGLRAYLSGNPDVWMVDTDLARRFYTELLEIGLKTKITVAYEHKLGETVHVGHSYDHKSRYLGGFDERCDILHLGRALSTPCSTAKSRYMWEVLLKDRAHLVRGKVEECHTPCKYVRKEFIPEKEEMRYSKMGRYLADNSWLQARDGSFRKPSELSLADLPEDWDRNEALAKALEMKLPEREQAMDVVTAGDPRLRKMIEYYQEAPEAEREKLLRLIPCELPPAPVPSFNEGLKSIGRVQRGRTEPHDTQYVPVSDVIRYQDKLGEEVEERVTKDRTELHTISFVPVRAQPSNEEAREFLYAEYHGRCQVTGTTFPKRSSNVNGEAHNYFEACALLSYADAAYLNNEGNMLCVSADTMAKLKHASFHWLDDIEEVIESFRKDSNRESVVVRIRLAGEDCSITWTQRHFMHLVALYDKA